jgi:hypothetical protein
VAKRSGKQRRQHPWSDEKREASFLEETTETSGLDRENQNEAILALANNIKKKHTQVKNTKITKSIKMHKDE